MTICVLFAPSPPQTDESLRQGVYPIDCLYRDQDEDGHNGGGIASCELLKKEFQNSAQQELTGQIRRRDRTCGVHSCFTHHTKPAYRQTRSPQERSEWTTFQKISEDLGVVETQEDGGAYKEDLRGRKVDTLPTNGDCCTQEWTSC
ncbi:hypothetical protein NFI96_007305 [Prochilodus magdalenae]|nr:hypothetical protein NFI96_007305 [Prochilodus magdalenae]